MGAKPIWKGLTNTEIRWNTGQDLWEICNNEDNDVNCFASIDVGDGLPVGEHSWNILPGYQCVDKSSEITLVLTSCKDGEFTCGDGTCIDVAKKCDIIEDCADSSDENKCGLLSRSHYKENYNTMMPDIRFDDAKKLVKAPLNVSIKVMKIFGIKEIDMKYEIQFDLILEWFDTRLTWMHLRDNKSFNFPFEEEIDRIWIPTLVFKNTKYEDMTMLDDKSIVLVEKQTEAFVDTSDLYETQYFHGSQNRASLSRTYSLELGCTFKLYLSPSTYRYARSSLVFEKRT